MFNSLANRLQQPPKARRQPLVLGQVHLMLGTFLRHPVAFQQARMQLKATHFPSDMSALGAVWGIVCNHWDKNEELPTPDILFTDIEQWVRQSDLETRDIQELDEFLNKVMMTPAKEIEKQVVKAREHLKQFMEQALQRELHRQVSSAEPIEMPALLESLTTQVQAISAVDLEKLSKPFADNDAEIPIIHKVSTGCDFFDKYLNGGQAAGEVYGLCAPYGVCKTLLAIQLAVERAKQEQEIWLQSGKSLEDGQPPIVYVVFYEEEEASFLARALSYEGKVNKTIVEEGRYNDMSSIEHKNYKPYERRMYEGQLLAEKPVPGEKERIKAAKATLNVNLRFIDFTGTKTNYREAAANFVPGIEAIIDQDQMSFPTPPGVSMVCVDYAGAAADRHCEHHYLDPTKHMRLLVGKMPLRLKNRIAVKFKCPVWCFHQLNTDSNSRQAGVAPKVTDTADARNFLENCTFGFLIGTKTKDDLVVMASRKQRRAGQVDESVLQIEGALARVRSTGNAYRIDRGTIVKAADRNRIAMMDEDEDEEEAEIENEFSSDLDEVGTLPKSGRKTF